MYPCFQTNPNNPSHIFIFCRRTTWLTLLAAVVSAAASAAAWRRAATRAAAIAAAATVAAVTADAVTAAAAAAVGVATRYEHGHHGKHLAGTL